MGERTRIALGRRADLGADCSRCVGLCCVALAFARSADFPEDKPAGEPCRHLDAADACQVHTQLRPLGYRGCTVFDCFGAGQQVSQVTFAGRSWRSEPADPAGGRAEMFAVFSVMRRLHELLWYLDQAIVLVDRAAGVDIRPWVERFEHVEAFTRASAADLLAVDVDAEYAAARPLLVAASERVRRDGPVPSTRHRGRPLGPGVDLAGADLSGADLSGVCLRGALLIGADLTGARLASCDVLGVDWRDADLSGADLGTALFLTQTQVNSARGDIATVLPAGYQRPRHWSEPVSAPPRTPPGPGPRGGPAGQRSARRPAARRRG